MRTTLIALALAAILLASACGGSSAKPTPTATSATAQSSSTAQPTPTAPLSPTSAEAAVKLYEVGYRSGVSTVDGLMSILESGDGDRLAGMMRLLDRNCTNVTGGNVVDPPCLEGEAEGTGVKAFVVASCQSGWDRESDAVNVLRRFGARKYQLFAAYRTASETGVEVEVHVVPQTPLSLGDGGFATVYLDAAGGIYGVSSNCGGRASVLSPADVTYVVKPRA